MLQYFLTINILTLFLKRKRLLLKLTEHLFLPQNPEAVCLTQNPEAVCLTQNPEAVCLTQNPEAVCLGATLLKCHFCDSKLPSLSTEPQQKTIYNWQFEREETELPANFMGLNLGSGVEVCVLRGPHELLRRVRS